MTEEISKGQNIFRIFYGIGLPILTVVLLVGVASFTERPITVNFFWDLLIRLFLVFYFGSFYRRVPKISTFSYYPNIKWKKSDVGPIEKYYLIGMGVFLGLGFGVLTWWTIWAFFTKDLVVLLCGSLINWVIVSYPIVTHYWVIKI